MPHFPNASLLLISLLVELSASAASGSPSLSFEANRGQVDSQVKFLARASGYGLFFIRTGVVLVSSSEASRFSSVKMKLLGANRASQVCGEIELPGRSHYFIGSNPQKWRTNVPHYARVRYREVYPGVDVVFQGGQGKLEYDLVVAPGADPGIIRVAFEGVQNIRLDERGDLLLRAAHGEIRQHRPLVYQEVNGARQAIPGHYVLTGRRQVGFRVAAFDSGRPLVIDPVLSYSSFLGGKGSDGGTAIAVDSSGNAYVTGTTTSTDFPTASPFQASNKGGTDVFVMRINSAGSGLVSSTYLGGSGADIVKAIAVDASGNAYVTGSTTSTDFPTLNPIQGTYRGAGAYRLGDVFVTKLNPTGSALLYSTYLGGSGDDVAYGVAVDTSGNAHIAGDTGSTNFPTANPLQAASAGNYDAFVAKLNATGSALIYSTYLGGPRGDGAEAIAIDPWGNTYVAGTTFSTTPSGSTFPTTPGAFQVRSESLALGEVFVAKLNRSGSALVYSSVFGGIGNDPAHGVAADSFGSVYVTGATTSDNFPTANAFQPNKRVWTDAFVVKLNAAGNALVYSTYLGGDGEFMFGGTELPDIATGIAVDSFGSAYVTGFTGSNNFPTTKDAVQTTLGPGICGKNTLSGDPIPCLDAFVTKLNPAGSALVYSTFLGGNATDRAYGIAVDPSGNAYITGSTSSTNFPTTGGAFRTAYADSQDAFVVKIADAGPAGPTVTTVSAASYAASVLSADSIAAAFGQGLAGTTQVADVIPLPTTLVGTTVKVTDSAGTERPAPLFFVSPGQVNYLIPSETKPGMATVTVTKDNAVVSTGRVQIEAVAPGLFAANANGRGVAAALAVRVRADGSQTPEPVFRFDPAQGRNVSVPIDLGPETDQVVLVLFGTGIRSRSALSAVSARIGGEAADVQYAGPQGGFVGLDQINLPLRRSLIGRGEVDVFLIVDGKEANPATINIR